MKKLAFALISLCLSSAVFAQSVRIINTDTAVDMEVIYCTSTKLACDKPTKSIVLPSPSKKSGKNYIDIRLPVGSDPSLQVINVIANGNQNKFSFNECEGTRSGDVITLNSYTTDAVVCDTRGLIEAKERN